MIRKCYARPQLLVGPISDNGYEILAISARHGKALQQTRLKRRWMKKGGWVKIRGGVGEARERS